MNTGTYVKVVATQNSEREVRAVMDALGIPNDLRVKEVHITLMYAPNSKNSSLETMPHINHRTEVVGVDVLGEGKWRALVLKVRCPSLVRRHNFLRMIGLEHSYPTFVPHVSLMYGPKSDMYAEKLKAYLDTAPQMYLDFNDEAAEPIKND